MTLTLCGRETPSGHRWITERHCMDVARLTYQSGNCENLNGFRDSADGVLMVIFDKLIQQLWVHLPRKTNPTGNGEDLTGGAVSP